MNLLFMNRYADVRIGCNQAMQRRIQRARRRRQPNIPKTIDEAKALLLQNDFYR